MPKKASCCCLNHGAWGHADDLILRIATVSEIKFCGINEDGRHNGRKRQICTSCRDRVNLQARCEELQVRLVFLVFRATLKAGNPESGIRNPESGIRNPESGIRNTESEIQRKSENKVNKKSFVTEPKTRRKKKSRRRRAGLCNTLVCAAL